MALDESMASSYAGTPTPTSTSTPAAGVDSSFLSAPPSTGGVGGAGYRASAALEGDGSQDGTPPGSSSGGHGGGVSSIDDSLLSVATPAAADTSLLSAPPTRPFKLGADQGQDPDPASTPATANDSILSAPSSRPFKFTGRSLRSSARLGSIATPAEQLALSAQQQQPRRSSRRPVHNTVWSPDAGNSVASHRKQQQSAPATRPNPKGKKAEAKKTSRAKQAASRESKNRKGASAGASAAGKKGVRAKGKGGKRREQGAVAATPAAGSRGHGASASRPAASKSVTPTHPTLMAPLAATSKGHKQLLEQAAAAYGATGKSRGEGKAKGTGKTKGKGNAGHGGSGGADGGKSWSGDERQLLRAAVQRAMKASTGTAAPLTGMWQQVAAGITGRSAAECCEEHLKMGEALAADTAAKKQKRARAQGANAASAGQGKEGGDSNGDDGGGGKAAAGEGAGTAGPTITARAGTLKRKQEIRNVMASFTATCLLLSFFLHVRQSAHTCVFYVACRFVGKTKKKKREGVNR